MGFLDRLRGRGPGRQPGPGGTPVHIGDPFYDNWDVVRDFEDAGTARAFHHTLIEAGIEAVLTADFPLDRFNRGDIALRVPPGSWSDAEELLGGLDFD